MHFPSEANPLGTHDPIGGKNALLAAFEDTYGLPGSPSNTTSLGTAITSVPLPEPLSTSFLAEPFSTFSTSGVLGEWNEGTLSTLAGPFADPLLGQPIESSIGELAFNELGHSQSLLPTQIIFIDSSISDDDELLTGLTFQAEIVRIEADQDGVTQISDYLAQRNNISAIHIVAHGNEGSLQLGLTELNGQTLAGYGSQLQAWSASLTEQADILIYGCDVAGNAQGEDFVNQISQLTGADVAASDDLTGNTELGGDWLLEYTVGAIEVDALTNGGYQGVLASAVLVDGRLIYRADDNGNTFGYSNNNQITLSRLGDELVITESSEIAEPIVTTGDASKINDYSVKVNLSAITSGIEIQTGLGDDTVTLSSGFSSFLTAINLDIDTGDGDDTVNLATNLSTQGGRVNIAAGDGDDTVTLAADLFTQGGDLGITAENIGLAAGSTISTRAITNLDPISANSIGDSGDITFTGKKITLGEAARTAKAQLLAQVDENSTFSAGDITINASATEAAATVFDGIEESSASISLDNTNVKGGTVVLSTQADYSEGLGSEKEVGDLIIGAVDNLSIFGGAALSKSTARITVDQTTDITAASFDASATAMTDAAIQLIFSKLIAAAYAKADSTAEVLFDGSVTTTGNVTISTATDTAVAVDSAASRAGTGNALLASAAAVAISELYSHSKAAVTDSAVITAGGDVSVTANTVDRNLTRASSGAGSDGFAAISAALSFEEGITEALIDGTVTAQGDVSLDAAHSNESIKSAFEGGTLLVKGRGVLASAGVSDFKGDLITGVGDSIKKGALDKVFSLFSSKTSAASDKTKGRAASVQVAGAAAYVSDNNQVTARIGGKYEDGNALDEDAASVTAAGSVSVQATVDYRPEVSASSALDTTDGAAAGSSNASGNSSTTGSTATADDEALFGGSVGVAIGDYTSTARAYIGNSASVDAQQALSVRSETLNDHTTKFGFNFADAISGDASVGEKVKTVATNVVGYLNNNLGADKYIFDSWSQATAKGEDTSLVVAGAVTVLNLSQTSEAYIGENAQINQNSAARSGNQAVSVEALNRNESLHFGGNIALPGLSWNKQQYSIKPSAGGVGSSGQSAVGAAVFVMDLANTTAARIADGVSLYGDSLKVDADNDTYLLDIAASGGKAETVGFNGVGSWAFVDNTTTAQIDDGVTLTIGDTLIEGTTHSLAVNAHDKTDTLNFMGSVALSESIGIGASVGFNTINRNTRAVIGNLREATDTSDTTILTSAGDIAVNAVNDGSMMSISLAGSVSNSNGVETDPDSTDAAKGYGIGVSAEVSLNEVADHTLAYLRDVELTLSQVAALEVTATNDSNILAIGGAIALAIGDTDQSAAVALAGSYGQNTVTQTTFAFLENVQQQSNSENLSLFHVQASNTSDIFAVNAGGAGAALSTVNASIAGAVSINEVDNTTEAYVLDSSLTHVTTATLQATDDTTIHADAGAVAIAATLNSGTAISLSAGIGLALNHITNDTRGYLSGSTLEAIDDVAIQAISTSDIDAFALGAAASVSSAATGLGLSLAGAGSGAKNSITNTITAAVQGGSSVSTYEALTVSANDNSNISLDAGAAALSVGVGTSAAAALAVGVAIAENEIRNTVLATLDNGTVTADTFDLAATSTASITTLGLAGAISVAVAPGGSASAAGAGTGVTNILNNTIQAYIQNNSTVTTWDDITLSATDDSTLETLALGGSISVSGSGGTSASLAVGAVTLNNTLGNTVQAFIGNDSSADNTVVKTYGGELNIAANSTLTLTENTAVAASFAAAAAPTGISLAGGGASVTTTTNNVVEAFIRNTNTNASTANDNNISVEGDLTLTATDTPTIHGTVGSGAAVASLIGASIAVSLTDTTINNQVRTYIDNAKVETKSGDLTLTATSTPTIEATSVATSVAASIGAAGAGAEATATVNTQVESRIGAGSDISSLRVTLTADSTDTVETDAYGIAAGFAGVGASVAETLNQSTTQAHVTGANLVAELLRINATGDGAAVSNVVSLAGGLLFAANGNSATTTVDTTVQAYVGDNTTIEAYYETAITATTTPQAQATATGVGVSAGVQIGFSNATATVQSQTDAYIDSNSTITTDVLTIQAQQRLATENNQTLNAASADASGSGGALVGSINASESTATNEGSVSAYVGDNSQLTIDYEAVIAAEALSQQTAETDGYNGGILAVGANRATAKSDLTTEAYLGTGVTISALSLAIAAQGNDTNTANSVAGGGGVVSGQAAYSSTDSTSSAKVRIEDGDATANNVELDIDENLTITAEQVTDFNSQANSINASIVGGSGAYTTNTVDTTATVEIGLDEDATEQDLVINAGSLTINATQTILKAELDGESAQAASGGVLDGAAVTSKTTIENSTHITIGDSSTTNGFGTTIATTGDDDDITLNAFNDVSAWEEALLDSGGVVSIAKAKSEISHDRNHALINIQDATLTSQQDITLSARADVTLDSTANASSYGLSGVPSAYSTATTATTNQIVLNDGSFLRSEGDVNLLAGQAANGNHNNIALNARSNIWNNTALPLSSPGSADATVTLNNLITVTSGALVQSVLDVNLLATEGDVESLGTLRSQDTYQALFGSTADIERDVDDITATTGVTVNGDIQVSIENQETLTIDEALDLSNPTTIDGIAGVYPINISQQTEGIGTVSLSTESLHSSITTYILQLQELKATYAGSDGDANDNSDDAVLAGYQAEIEYWESQRDALGTVDQVAYINVPDITARMGDIRVTGDYFSGSGSLASPGDAKITITNNSPYALKLNALTIPEIEGGRILFNSISVANNDDINHRNDQNHTAGFSTITTAENTDEARIDVENTYDPTFAAQQDEFLQLGNEAPAAPNLKAEGAINNFKGTVRLASNEGNVIVNGSLNAKNIDIDSGGDFVLNDEGTVLEFSPSAINVANNTVTLIDHGLSTGDQVFYSNGDLTNNNSVGGLADARSYFAIVVNDNTIKLAQTEEDSLRLRNFTLSSITFGGIFTLPDHGLSVGDTVSYKNPSQPNTTFTLYVWEVQDANTLKLSLQKDVFEAALAGSGTVTINPEIDLSSRGSGSGHTFSLTDDLGFFHAGGDPRSQLADNASTFESFYPDDQETHGDAVYTNTNVLTGDLFSEQTAPTSSLTASSNVFINARYLNINGLIQSGSPDRKLTLESTLDSTISAFKASYDNGQESSQYLILSIGDNGSIEARYDAERDRIELDNVDIEGGYMQLEGHILSTGHGKLEVIDGFGRIDIDNNTSYDLAVNNIDTGGSGIEGKLQIIDTAQTGADGEALVTTYTRLGDNITKTDTSAVNGNTTLFNNTRTTGYNPIQGQRYTWITGQGNLIETEKTYGKSTFWGSDDLARDPGQTIETTTTLLDETPLLEGAFVSTDGDPSKNSQYGFNRDVVITSANTHVDQDTWETSSGWWIFSTQTHYRRDTFHAGQKNINTHSYGASHAVEIEFIGYDTGAVQIDSVSGDLLLQGALRNEGGETELLAYGGASIEHQSATDLLTSETLTLWGGQLTDIRTDVDTLNFTATQGGDVSIEDIQGNVTVNNGYSRSGTVSLTTEGSLLGPNTLIAGAVNLFSRNGSIGTASQSFQLNTHNVAELASAVTLTAADDIYVQETEGDVHLVSATAGGDVNIVLTDGNLIDANFAETIDPYSEEQLVVRQRSVGILV